MSARTVRLAAALAAALLAPAARAYVRTTSSEGACFFWRDRIIGFKINAARMATSVSCGDTTQSADTAAIQAVRSAFRTWTGETQACTDLQLFDGGLTDSRSVGFDQRSGAQNENLVVFRGGWCSAVAPGGLSDRCWDVDPFATPAALGETCANKYNCFEDASPADRSTIAITTVTHNPRSGQIVDADIEFADWTGQMGALATRQPPYGWYFTCGDDMSTCATYGQEACAYVDLQSNATHEVGHFVGLAHPCEIGDRDCSPGTSPYADLVMFPSATPADTSKRTLRSDDQAGLCAIYPTGLPTATCVPESGGGGGGGCASGGAGGILSALLALAALARNRRRAPRG